MRRIIRRTGDSQWSLAALLAGAVWIVGISGCNPESGPAPKDGTTAQNAAAQNTATQNPETENAAVPSQGSGSSKPKTAASDSTPPEAMIQDPEGRVGNEVTVEPPAASVTGPPILEPPRNVPAGVTPPRKGRSDAASPASQRDERPNPDAATPGPAEPPPNNTNSPDTNSPDADSTPKLQPVNRPSAAATQTPLSDSNTVPAAGRIALDRSAPPRNGKVALATPTKGKVLPGGKRGEYPDFDPVKENGAHFVGWPKPDLAIVASGCLNGYLEPCGCAGMDRMKGGLKRRHSFMDSLRTKRGWSTIGVDVGGIPKRFGPQAVCKYKMAYEALRDMGYSALGLGVTDLRLPIDELISIEGDRQLLTCANVAFYDTALGMPKRYQIVDAGPYKVGVAAVLNEEQCKSLHNSDLQCLPPTKALQDVLAELEKERCNLAILLAYGPKKWAEELAEQFPQFRFVVTSDGAPEPPPKPVELGSGRYLIEVGEKGMYVSVLGIYKDDPKIRYQRVTLDSRYAAAKQVDTLMRQYQTELKLRGLSGLHIKPKSHPDADRNGDYVGSEKCKSCHEESYKIWQKSKHAHAWESLLPPHSDPGRTHDPECISCHVVGWHPTEYFPYKTGFLSEEKTPKLCNVGCESCHGPGGEHVEAEMHADMDRQEAAYKAVRVTLEEAKGVTRKSCYSCHDLDNSPDFDFETYWPLVEHKETE